MIFIRHFFTILLVLCGWDVSIYAKNFGINGHVYQISEQPFLSMIHDRLSKVDILAEQTKMQNITATI